MSKQRDIAHRVDVGGFDQSRSIIVDGVHRHRRSDRHAHSSPGGGESHRDRHGTGIGADFRVIGRVQGDCTTTDDIAAIRDARFGLEGDRIAGHGPSACERDSGPCRRKTD